MATTARKNTTSTTTTTTPATPPAAAKPAAAPAVVDMAKLAAGATEIKELPKLAVGGNGQKGNVWTPLVQKSVEQGKSYSTPAVPKEQALKVQDAIWRAANQLGLKCATRRTAQEDGTVVISFKAERKPAAKK